MGYENQGRGPAGHDQRGPAQTEPRHDPGAYIGRKPERATSSIPGGHGRKDRRVSAVATQPGDRSVNRPGPEGHREGAGADDAGISETGQDR